MNALAEHIPLPARDNADTVCLDRFESRYQALMTSSGGADTVSQALCETMQARGKRVRPLLMMHAAADLGVPQANVIDLAVAIEMVHTSSLILDDLPCMDNGQFRRGRMTMHREFGEHVAILAAVGLLMKAFEIIANDPAMSADQRTAIVGKLSKASGLDGLVKGQLRDLQEGFSNQTSADAQTTNQLKTGVLFDAALQSVAVLAQAHPLDAGALVHCANDIGHAFQLADDLKDDPAYDAGTTGKDVGKDIGKPTLAAMVGKGAAYEQIRLRMMHADACLAASSSRFDGLRQYMRDISQSFLRE